MIGKHKFKVGQRVRASRAGQRENLFQRKHWNEIGVVTKVDNFNCPSVRWAHRKTASSYHPDFIEPIRTQETDNG